MCPAVLLCRGDDDGVCACGFCRACRVNAELVEVTVAITMIVLVLTAGAAGCLDG